MNKKQLMYFLLQNNKEEAFQVSYSSEENLSNREKATEEMKELGDLRLKIIQNN